MSDPPRWLDDPDQLDDKELSVLTAGRDATPRATLRREVWSTLALRLPIAASVVSKAAAAAPQAGSAVAGAGGSVAGTGVTGTSVAASAGFSAIVKAVAVGATAGGLLMGGVALTTSTTPTPTSGGAHTRTQQLHAPDVARGPRRGSGPPLGTTAALPGPIVETEAASDGNASTRSDPKLLEPRGAQARESTHGAGASARRANGPNVGEARQRDPSARDESRLVASARDRLRAHDIAGAERDLERARALFPGGVLIQEREALWIEALAASGRSEQARARAAAFLRAYPKSPHAARVRAIADW